MTSLSLALTWRLSFTGDGDEEFALYHSDILDDVCGSDGDPAPSSALAEDPGSPLLSDEDSSAQDTLSFRHQSIFLPQEDLSVPLDFDLRESAVPGSGLGIWSRRRITVGERFGPYEGEHRPSLRDPTRGWEVGTSMTWNVNVLPVVQNYCFTESVPSQTDI